LLFINRIDQNRAGSKGNAKKNINYVLIIFAAVFLMVTVLSGAMGDYGAYVTEWNSINQGRNPYDDHYPGGEFNAYGPAFNVLAPLIWISPFATKLICASLYLAFVVWLIKEYGPRRGANVPTWLAFGLLIFNLYPWEQIACYGYFDVLMGLCCVASIHCLSCKREGFSGAILGAGILVKFMPIVILPFLAFGQRRLHARFMFSCVALVIGGLLTGMFFWGESTFIPIIEAEKRPPEWSVYVLMYSKYFPIHSLVDKINMEIFAFIILAGSGISLFYWFMRNSIVPIYGCAMAVLITLITYKVGFVNYSIILFCIFLYLIFFEWENIKNNKYFIILVIVYFNFQSIFDIYGWVIGDKYIWKNILISTNFILGVTLFIYLGIVSFSLRGRPQIQLGGGSQAA
jgi:hypothetical protein